MSEVLQSYLIKLAYQVDGNSSRKFTGNIAAVGKAAMGLGAVLIGAGLAAKAMTDRFAGQMDKLFYASQRADASASNLQALEYAASRVGIEGGKLTSIMEGLNTAILTDPGKKGLIESLGIDTSQDKAAVLLQTMQKLFEMPDLVGSQFAGRLLGMSQADYLQLKRNRAEFERFIAEKQKSQSETGIDADAAAEAAHKYSNALKTMTDRLGVLRDAIGLAFIGPFQQFTEGVTAGLDRMIRIFGKWADSSSAFGKSWDGFKKFLSGDFKAGWQMMQSGKEELGAIMSGKGAAPATVGTPQAEARKAQLAASVSPSPSPVVAPSPGNMAPRTAAQASPANYPQIPADVFRFAQAAATKIGVPVENVLAQIRNEIGGKFKSSIGAYNFTNIKAGKSWQGDTTEKRVHEVDKNGKVYYENSKFRAYKTPEEGGEDFAKLMMRMYPGTIGATDPSAYAKALQSGVGGAKFATDPQYVEKILGNLPHVKQAPTINQTNTYNITGNSSDAKPIADSIGAMQQRTNADAVRNLRGDMR